MTVRLLVLGAGTAAGENVIRSLRAADSSLILTGAHSDRFVLKHSAADVRHLLPHPGAPDFAQRLRQLITTTRSDLVVPTTDRHVRALSHGRRHLRSKTFLPTPAVIELCSDKYRLSSALRRRGVPAPNTIPVAGLKGIGRIFDRFPKRPLWCRPRTGTCARGGGAVSNPEQARRWIQLWQTMQGVPVRSFTLSEYLPGREILCQSVWDRGRMVLANTFERLSYFATDNIPSGVTSLSSLAKTVVEPAAVELCRRAVNAVAPGACGAFSIDVKEDAEGQPRVTEINAGRFFMAMTAFDRVLKHSMTITYVRVALGQPVGFSEEYDAIGEYYMVRDMDIAPGIFHADDLLEGPQEVPAEARPQGARL